MSDHRVTMPMPLICIAGPGKLYNARTSLNGDVRRRNKRYSRDPLRHCLHQIDPSGLSMYPHSHSRPLLCARPFVRRKPRDMSRIRRFRLSNAKSNRRGRTSEDAAQVYTQDWHTPQRWHVTTGGASRVTTGRFVIKKKGFLSRGSTGIRPKAQCVLPCYGFHERLAIIIYGFCQWICL